MSSSYTISGEQTHTGENIDYLQYLKVINRYKWRVLLLAIAVSILTAIMTMKMTPIYSATATLLIEADQAKAISFEEAIGLGANRKEYFSTQLEILKSHQLAKLVIEHLHLQPPNESSVKASLLSKLKASIPFIPQKNKSSVTASTLTEQQRAEQKQHAFTSAFLSRLSLSPIKNTQLVNITYQSNDPQLAANAANAFGDIYIEQDLANKIGVTQQAVDWLRTQLFHLRDSVDESEAKLQNYREQESLIDVNGVSALVGQELAQILAQLVTARNEKNQLKSIINVMNENGYNTIDRLEAISQITSSQALKDIKARLINNQRYTDELVLVYGLKHPKMLAAQAELLSIKASYQSQITQLITAIEQKFKTKNSDVRALEQETTRVRAKYQQIIRKENTYHKLKRDVEANRKIYDTFLLRSKETEVTIDLTSTVARFVDRATRPMGPFKPKKSLIVMIAFIVALAFGVAVVLVVDALNDTIKLPSDIENKLSQRMLGMLPLLEVDKSKSVNHYSFFEQKDKRFSEAVRTLRTSFVLSQLDKDSKVIEVTSTVPSEGKTFTAINLSFSLGQMEKTILIDADMRRPSLAKAFGIATYLPGLVNYIAGTEKLEDCIYQDQKSGITVMPCGLLPSNPLELLSSPRFKAIIDELKLSYDRIVVDTPPIHAVSDALIIAQKVDSVVYVVKGDSSRVGLIQNGLKRLEQSNTKIAGLVLNQIDIKKLNNEYSHNSYYYYNYDNIQE